MVPLAGDGHVLHESAALADRWHDPEAAESGQMGRWHRRSPGKRSAGRVCRSEGAHLYAAAAVAPGWFRNMLLNQVRNRTHERVGASPMNFGQELTAADSDQAKQATKVLSRPGVGEILDPLKG